MRRFVVAFILVLSVGFIRAVAPDPGKAHLKELVRVPLTVPGLELDFDPGSGFAFFTDEPSGPEAMAELVQKLRDSPDDAKVYLDLARLEAKAGLKPKATQHFQMACQIARRQIELEPEDVKPRLILGEAELALGQWNASQQAFRGAAANQANNAEAWLELGRFFQKKSARLLERNWQISLTDFHPDGRTFRRAPLGWAAASEAQSELAESEKCLERAGAAAGSASSVRFRLSLAKVYQNFLVQLLEADETRQADPAPLLDSVFAPRALRQMKQIAGAEPRDFNMSANIAVYEALVWSPKRGLPGSLRWADLPEAVRSSILDRITVMENFAQDGEAKEAARALQEAGLLKAVLLRDFPGAAGTLERALRLAPERQRNWELLIFCLDQARSFDRLLSICDEWPRQQRSVHTLSVLAEAQSRLNLLDKAERTIGEALALDENDFEANLTAAALLLKRGDNPINLMAAGLYLAKAEKSSKSRQDAINLALTKSLYQAFRNNLPEARRLLKRVLDMDPDNEYARRLLAALQSE